MSDTETPLRTGPILFSRGAGDGYSRLAALVVEPDGREPSQLKTCEGATHDAERLAVVNGNAVWRYDFSLPARADAWYALAGTPYPVAADLAADVRIAYVSCNGQEHGDAERELDERNTMWNRLAQEHEETPFHLMLHGGDQLYADDILQCHPGITRWTETPEQERGAIPFTDAMRQRAEIYLFSRYLALAQQPHVARISARVPSLMMWDDHDIFDGWGSRAEAVLDSPVGRGILAVAERMFCLFQLGVGPAGAPEIALEAKASHHSLSARFPGFTVIAPDLRTERRPHRVLSEAGWDALEDALAQAADQSRVLLMSSVPALGPRLSWVEQFLHIVPRMQKYEDDLRDQWQSRAHRSEWVRLLTLLEHAHTKHQCDVTVLSGEIHLATRGEMRLPDGAPIHQLVASGIAHPPPPTAYARALGALARLGEAPVPGRPIRLYPLPGRRSVYTNQRNYLVLSRVNGVWQAAWELENAGRTSVLYL